MKNLLRRFRLLIALGKFTYILMLVLGVMPVSVTNQTQR
jgi:hypothetical protein